MRLVAIVLACALSACASTYAANPEDPVDMAAELGNRGKLYVGMGEVCDTAIGGAHREAVTQAIRAEQQNLGVLSGLVERAHRGHASDELAAHMATQMNVHNISAERFCGETLRQARYEISARSQQVQQMPPLAPNPMDYARLWID